MQKLGEALKNLPCLQKIHFDITHCKIGDEGMLGLGQGLKDSTSIENIYLNFQEYIFNNISFDF